MQFRKFGSKYILRLDKSEEIVSVLKQFCQKQKLKLGVIWGLGATNNVTVGLFKTSSKKYLQQTLQEDFEICPLFGFITTMNNEIYLHLHINLANKKQKSFGGHLNQAVVSATFEVVIEKIEGEVDRKFSKKIGLNLLQFN